MISILIVNWNTGDLLAQCLKSLTVLSEAERKIVQRIVIVDNNSSDTSFEQAEELSTDLSVDFIKLDENIGFARANNIGFEHLRQWPQTDVLLLNPDTEVLPGALSTLSDTLAHELKAGVVGPQLLNPDKTIQPSVRVFPSLGVLLFLVLKLHYLFPRAAFWQKYLQQNFNYTKEQVVDQVMGAAMLIRKPLATGLDPRLQWWFDDVAMCKRAYKEGWTVLYTPHAKIIHHGGVSFGRVPSFTKWWRFTVCAFRYFIAYAI